MGNYIWDRNFKSSISKSQIKRTMTLEFLEEEKFGLKTRNLKNT